MKLTAVKKIELSYFLTQLGDWLSSLIIYGWCYDISGSPTVLGVSILASRLFMTVGSLAFGNYVESQFSRVHFRFNLICFFSVALMGAVTFLFREKIGPFEDNIFTISIFLFLTCIRSTFLGPLSPSRSKIISELFTPEEASQSERSIVKLMYVTGILSSLIYYFFYKEVFVGWIILFDALTFLASGYIIKSIELSHLEDLNKKIRKFSIELFSFFRDTFSVTHITWSSVIRSITGAILFQQTLNILKDKFLMGDETTGIMYLCLTVSWFVSGKFVGRFLKGSIQDSTFLFFGTISGAFCWIPWYIESPWGAAVTIFGFWFIEGVLLVIFPSQIQKRVKKEWIGRFFSGYSGVYNFVFAFSNLFLAFTASSCGANLASVIFASIATVFNFLIGIHFVLYGRIGLALHIKRFYKKLGLEFNFYLETKELSKMFDEFDLDEICFTEAILENPSDFKLSGHSCFIFDNKHNEIVKDVINVTYAESVERYIAKEIVGLNGIPFTNGNAVQVTADKCEKSAVTEMFERHNFLKHYFDGERFECELQFSSLDIEKLRNGFNLISVFRLKEFLDQFRIFKMKSPRSKGIFLFATFRNEKFQTFYGLGADYDGNFSKAIQKSILECICSRSFTSFDKIKDLLSYCQKMARDNVDQLYFDELKEKFGRTNLETQQSLIVSSPIVKKRISNLISNVPAISLAEINSEEDKIQYKEDPSIKINFEETGIALYFCMARSNELYQLKWPCIFDDEICPIA